MNTASDFMPEPIGRRLLGADMTGGLDAMVQMQGLAQLAIEQLTRARDSAIVDCELAGVELARAQAAADAAKARYLTIIGQLQAARKFLEAQ